MMSEEVAPPLPIIQERRFELTIRVAMVVIASATLAGSRWLLNEDWAFSDLLVWRRTSLL